MVVDGVKVTIWSTRRLTSIYASLPARRSLFQYVKSICTILPETSISEVVHCKPGLAFSFCSERLHGYTVNHFFRFSPLPLLSSLAFPSIAQKIAELCGETTLTTASDWSPADERAGHAGFWLEQTMPISPLFLPIHRVLMSFIFPLFVRNSDVPHFSIRFAIYHLFHRIYRFRQPHCWKRGSLCNKQHANSSSRTLYLAYLLWPLP